MKKVNISDMDVAMSIKGKGTCKRYAFNDFSDLIKVRGNFPKQKKRGKKTHVKKKKQRFGLPIGANCTHILIECEPRSYVNEDGREVTLNEQWIVLDYILPPNRVKGKFPTVKELMYSRDEVAFSDDFFISTRGASAL